MATALFFYPQVCYTIGKRFFKGAAANGRNSKEAKFIDLPIKIQTFHRKNTPVHWGNFYPIKQECSLAQQKTFIGLKVSVPRKQPKYLLV